MPVLRPADYTAPAASDRPVSTLPSFILHSSLIWFWGWETAEENCNRLEVTLQEMQGTNKQEGVARAHCGRKLLRHSAWACHMDKMHCLPYIGNKWVGLFCCYSSIAWLQLQNLLASLESSWEGRTGNVCGNLRLCLFEKWKYWLQPACLGQSMTSPLLYHRLVISTVMLLAPRQQGRWLIFPNSDRRIIWRNASN